MASGRLGTLYTGVTSDLPARVYAHREGLVPGFTKRYGCKLLVWYQYFDDL
jgi:putative endonuclease